MPAAIGHDRGLYCEPRHDGEMTAVTCATEERAMATRSPSNGRETRGGLGQTPQGGRTSSLTLPLRGSPLSREERVGVRASVAQLG